jgi:hypothetical protein
MAGMLVSTSVITTTADSFDRLVLALPKATLTFFSNKDVPYALCDRIDETELYCGALCFQISVQPWGHHSFCLTEQ